MKQPKSIQISIPSPCHEDWNKMTQQEQGRFCSSCQKCVVDFRHLSDDALIEFYHRTSNEHVCGIFRESQLNREIFKPQNKKSYYNWFISLSITLWLNSALGIDAVAQTDIKKEWVQGSIIKHTDKTISGVITDINNKPIVGATIIAYEGVIAKGGAFTDSEGAYIIKPLNSGRYDLEIRCKAGYKKTIIQGVTVMPEWSIDVSLALESLTFPGDTTVVVKDYLVPVIDDSSGSAKYSEERAVMGIRIVSPMVTTSAAPLAQPKQNFFKRLWHKIF